MQRLSIISTLVANLAIVGCAKETTAPGPSALEAGTSASRSGASSINPFNGSGSGRDVSVTYEVTGIRIVANATGNANGLGRFTEVLDYVLSYDLVNFAGTGSMTAATGDQLFLTFHGSIPGFAKQIFPLPYTADFLIVEGTGRLGKWTGGGRILGTDYGQGLFAFTFTGTRDPELSSRLIGLTQ